MSDSEASVIARYVTVSFYGLGAAGQVCARMDRLRDLKGRRRSWEAGERDGVVLRPMIRLQLDSQVFVPGRFSASAAPRAPARILYFDSLVSELFLEAL